MASCKCFNLNLDATVAESAFRTSDKMQPQLLKGRGIGIECFELMALREVRNDFEVIENFDIRPV